MTCFRVRDWVTHVIRGADREFCQRRVGHRHSRPATTGDRSFCCCSTEILRKTLDFKTTQNGRRVRIEVRPDLGGYHTDSVSDWLNFLLASGSEFRA